MKDSDQGRMDPSAQGRCACREGRQAAVPDGGQAAPAPRWRRALKRLIQRVSGEADRTPAGGLDTGAMDRLIAGRNGQDRGLIELLQEVSERFGYLPPEALRYISKAMQVPLTRLYSIATFYQDFKLEPQGRHRLTVCTGTACHVKGAAAIVDVLCREHNLTPGDTTADGRLTLSTVNCIGLCGVGPVAILDGDYQSQLTADKALQMVKAL